ncbi:MAG TPA: hypothetical protein VEO18_03950 [Thermoplasmata archaeon]|nr:hypothetical protein [Thermoplasmata archaeon]
MAEAPEKKKPASEQLPAQTEFPIFPIDVMTKSDKNLSSALQLETKNKLKKAD